MMNRNNIIRANGYDVNQYNRNNVKRIHGRVKTIEEKSNIGPQYAHNTSYKYDEQWKDQTYTDKITDFIHLGNAQTALNFKHLNDMGIKAMLSIGECNFDKTKLLEYKNAGIARLFIKVEDGVNGNMEIYFKKIYKYISAVINKNMNLYIHCSGGISRAPAAILYYMVRCAHDKLERGDVPPIKELVFIKLYNIMKQKRMCIDIETNLLAQIGNAEKKIVEDNNNYGGVTNTANVGNLSVVDHMIAVYIEQEIQKERNRVNFITNVPDR